jgi:hypothetical protein
MRLPGKTCTFVGTFPRLLQKAPRTLVWTTLLLLISSAVTNTVRAGKDTDRIHWQQVPGSQVKLDDKTPLAWNVYQPDKKDNKKYSRLILVLLGRRYLMLDTRSKLVYEVAPTDLKAQGNGFESDNLTQRSRLIPSSEWGDRDVGPAELIRLKLGDYGRVLRVSLPHPPDLRPFY